MKNKLFAITATALILTSPWLFAQDELDPGIAAPPGISQAQGPGKISLDIKGMDVVDVIKMLSSRANLNVVIGKNVTGRVTLFLKDVDVWDAFEIILLSNDLAYDTKNGIINVMSQRDYELIYGERYQDKKQAKIVQLKYGKAADLSRALMQIKSNIGKVVVDEGSNTIALIDSPGKIREMEEFIKKTDLPLETKVFNLNYAVAEKLLPKIQEAVTKGVGSVRADERSNKVAVTDYPAKLDEIGKVIASFDEKPQQVLIDAQIIELTPSDTFKMGVDWDYWIEKNVRVMETLPSVGGMSFLKAGRIAQGLGVDKTGQYKAILDLLRTIGDTKILSSPRIMAVNNQEAKILVGTKEAYITQTTSQSGTGTEVIADEVNFVDVGIKLYVTPTINKDSFVTMKIRPEISSATYKDFGTTSNPQEVPIVTTSEAETVIMVKDGITVLIGGLQKDKREKTVKKVPLLGDIPGLGFMFRNTSDSVTKTELVILLTPHLMTGEDALIDFADIKPKEGAVKTMVDGKIVTEKVSQASNKAMSQGEVSAYYKLIADKVRSLTFSVKGAGEKGMVEAAFLVNSSGYLKGEPRIVSSTNHNLDNTAIANIKNSAPFPPFPAGMDKDEESFRVALEYK